MASQPQQAQHPPGSDSRSTSTPPKRDDGSNANKAIRIPRDPQSVPQQRRRAHPVTTVPKYPAGYFFG
jgi:hypothetical protein